MVWSIISWINLQEIKKKAQNQSGRTGKINGALEHDSDWSKHIEKYFFINFYIMYMCYNIKYNIKTHIKSIFFLIFILYVMQWLGVF